MSIKLSSISCEIRIISLLILCRDENNNHSKEIDEETIAVDNNETALVTSRGVFTSLESFLAVEKHCCRQAAREIPRFSINQELVEMFNENARESTESAVTIYDGTMDISDADEAFCNDESTLYGGDMSVNQSNEFSLLSDDSQFSPSVSSTASTKRIPITRELHEAKELIMYADTPTVPLGKYAGKTYGSHTNKVKVQNFKDDEMPPKIAMKQHNFPHRALINFDSPHSKSTKVKSKNERGISVTAHNVQSRSLVKNETESMEILNESSQLDQSFVELNVVIRSSYHSELDVE